MELNTDPGGEGKWRGGHGIRLDYRIRRDDSFLTLGYTRSRILPWSLDGGNEGSANYALVLRKNGESERYAFASGIRVDKDDVIRVITGAGGGFGNPKERDPALVLEDIRNEYVTAERARAIYGSNV